MKRAEVAFNMLRVPVDLALLVGAGIVVYLMRTQALAGLRPVAFSVELPLDRFLWLTIGVAGLFVLVYAVSGLYAMKVRMSRGQEAVRVLVASSAAIMLVILVIFLQATLFNSRFLVVGYWGIATVMVIFGRLTLRTVYVRAMAWSGVGAQRVLLVGDDEVTERVACAIAADPGLGYRIVGRCTDPDLAQVTAAVRTYRVDEVILANPNHPPERVVDLVDFCHDRHIAFTFVPNIHQTLTTNWDVQAIGQTPVVQLRRTALDGWGRVFKRACDIVGSACALVVLSPLLAAVALAIKWETYGPVFVRLPRVSRNRQFGLLKFRSMVAVDADGSAESLKGSLAAFNERPDGPLFKMRNDPRVTRVGRFLRRTRLDELPQFINVFRGDISLVGPRPHQPDEVARYERRHRKVLAIKSGATGLAQVSGASDLPFEDEVALDTFYIENWSLVLDLRILLRTAIRMLFDRSAV